MDACLFLQALQCILPDSLSSHESQTGVPLKCKTRFHICLEEQHAARQSIPTAGSWAGLLAQGTVNIRLRLPDGSCKATIDAAIRIPGEDAEQGQQPAPLQLEWLGQQYHVDMQQVVKVVCSAGVAAAAATHQHGQLHGQSCLLAPPVSLPSDQMQGFAHVEWISLITRHVCLDIMVPDQPDATQQLGRLVRALHQGAPCCATTHTPHPHTAAQAPATSSSCATDTSSGRAGTLDNQHSNTQPPAATMDTVHPVHLLVGATCDMHMMQLLLDQVAQQQSSSSAAGGAAGSNAAGESLQQFRAQHLLDAVAHLHASQRSV